MNDQTKFPFQATEPPSPDADDVLCANGIFADTGLPLCQISVKEAAEIAASQTSSKVERQQSRAKLGGDNVKHLGVRVFRRRSVCVLALT